MPQGKRQRRAPMQVPEVYSPPRTHRPARGEPGPRKAYSMPAPRRWYRGDARGPPRGPPALIQAAAFLQPLPRSIESRPQFARRGEDHPPRRHRARRCRARAAFAPSFAAGPSAAAGGGHRQRHHHHGRQHQRGHGGRRAWFAVGAASAVGAGAAVAARAWWERYQLRSSPVECNEHQWSAGVLLKMFDTTMQPADLVRT